MKRVLLIFLMCYTFSYSSYLISNSEIVLFYDKIFNNIHFIKGDIFGSAQISKIEGKLILDGKDILTLNDYFKEATILKGNILNLTYAIQGKEISISLIPSTLQRDKLYVVVDLKNIILDRRIDFILHIIPQEDNGSIEYNPKSNSFVYGENIFFKSENYGGRTFISRDGVIENFLMEEVTKKTKKYQEDNLYYLVSNIKKDEPILFTFKFFDDFIDNKKVDIESVIKDENRWYSENIIDAITGERYGRTTQELLRQLRFLTSRAVVPDSISYNKSNEDITNKIKLFYLCSKFQPDFDVSRLFLDLNTRKTEIESAIYYRYLLTYLKEIGKSFDSKYFNWKVEPEVLSLVDLVEESGELFDTRDNIYNYYNYYKLIDFISKLDEFSNEREYIEKKKKLLYDYIIKNYTLSDGIKRRRGDSKSNYKNIGYIDILPQEVGKKILLSNYKKYYNKKSGVLKGAEEERVDMRYNLEFVLKLYENNLKEEGNRLLKNLEGIIAQNNYYLIPKIDLDGENSAGIYGELLYLYLIAVQYRESQNGYTK